MRRIAAGALLIDFWYEQKKLKTKRFGMEKSTRLLAHKVGPPVAVPISSVPVASVANFIYLSALYSSSCLILHLIKEGILEYR